MYELTPIVMQGLNVPLTDEEELAYCSALALGYKQLEREMDGSFTGVYSNEFVSDRSPLPEVEANDLTYSLVKYVLKAEGIATLQPL